MPQQSASRGFTLAETLLAVSILTVAVLAVVQALTAGHFQSREAVRSARATALAEAMIERALALPYHDPDGTAASPGPDAGETTPADYDNADDYHGYTESPGNLTDAAGVAYPPAYQAFQRRVTASYDTLNVPGLGGARPGLRITVVVENPQGRTWRIQRFIPQPQGGG